MLHPVFRNTRSLILYAGTWIAVIAVHFSVLFFFYGLPLKYSLADSASFNIIFAFNGLVLWFVVRYSPPRSGSLWNIVFNHVSSAALILVVWLGVSYLVLNVLFSGDERYLGFVRDSISWRAIIGLMFYILTGLAYYLIVMYGDVQER